MDLNTNAHRIVAIAIGEKPAKSAAKAKAGSLGGKARAQSLSKTQRKKIARRANRARWK
jgi:hypothetical protein